MSMVQKSIFIIAFKDYSRPCRLFKWRKHNQSQKFKDIKAEL